MTSNVGSARTRAIAAWSSGSRLRRPRPSALRSPSTIDALDRALDVRVREGRLPAIDVLLKRLVDAGVDRGRLVLSKHSLPDRIGALGRVEGAGLLPLLERVVV